MEKRVKEYTLNEVRKFYGFSQQQLATFLGISRSTLNMTERGERAMKIDAEIKLLKLVRTMISAKTAPKKELSPAKGMDKKKKKSMASEAIRDVEFKIKKLHKRMDAVNEKNSNYFHLLNAFSELKTGAEKREMIIINLMEVKLRGKLNKINEEHQVQSELKLFLANAEKSFWQKKLKEA